MKERKIRKCEGWKETVGGAERRRRRGTKGLTSGRKGRICRAESCKVVKNEGTEEERMKTALIKVWLVVERRISIRRAGSCASSLFRPNLPSIWK